MKMAGLDSQFWRFIVTGLLSNGASYAAFLIAVYIFGVGHKAAASILFIVGVLINYTVNKNWTFGLSGNRISTMTKFFITYFAGYFLNIGMLTLFVDHMDYSPAWVQFFAIGVLVIYYFVMNKYFIFKTEQ